MATVSAAYGIDMVMACDRVARCTPDRARFFTGVPPTAARSPRFSCRGGSSQW
jgi:hypothetical protein